MMRLDLSEMRFLRAHGCSCHAIHLANLLFTQLSPWNCLRILGHLAFGLHLILQMMMAMKGMQSESEHPTEDPI